MGAGINTLVANIRKSDFQEKNTQITSWLQEALLTRKADSYFNPLIEVLAPSYGLSSKYQKAKVVDIHKHHENAVTLKVQPPKSWQGFVPGQYVSCEFEVNGIRRKRNYSISSSLALFEQMGQIELSIHRAKDGLVSNFILEELRLNTLFSVSEAMGEFGAELDTNTKVAQEKPILMLAAGSGITPLASMLASAQHGDRETHLIYSCGSKAEHLFKNSFEKLEELQPNFHLKLHTTQEAKSDKRINSKLIDSCCKNIENFEVFICGSNAFTENMNQQLRLLGVKEESIYFESFDSALSSCVDSEVDSEVAEVNFSISNKKSLSKGTSSLLEQAEKLGLNPKNGCRMGVCHTCTCTKKSGVVRNLLTGEVSAADQEEIRICISQPVGKVDIAL